MSETTADIVVIGGGPAGCACAIMALQRQRTVILVESCPFPRHRPGETLPPGIEPLFRKLGVWEAVSDAGFIRHRGHWLTSKGKTNFVPFGGVADEWYGIQAWRPLLDTLLLEKARGMGARVLQPCRALYPIINGGIITGVATAHGEIKSSHVIDATGRGSWITRCNHYSTVKRSSRLLATYGYVETPKAADWRIPHFTITDGGWSWVAQVRPNLVAWSRLSANGFSTELPSDLLTDVHARAFSVGTSTADVTWRCSTKAAGPGWFVVGDAAIQLDPSSSHGVLRAVMSGMMAAELAVHVLDGRLSSEGAVAIYNKWIFDWFEHDVTQLTASYGSRSAFPKWLGPNVLTEDANSLAN